MLPEAPANLTALSCESPTDTTESRRTAYLSPAQIANPQNYEQIIGSFCFKPLNFVTKDN